MLVGNLTPSPCCWFSKNYHFAVFSNILLETFVPNIRQNSDEGIFNFRISGQYIIKNNVITPEPVMTLTWVLKLRQVSKLDKTNKKMWKNDDDVMSEICDVIAIFPIYDQFGSIRKTDSRYIVCKTYIIINSKLLSCKNWKHN